MARRKRQPPGNPPGTVRGTGPGHGMAAPIGELTPLDELRRVLNLSTEVRADEVYRTAIGEIARLREGSTEPVLWVEEDEEAPIGRAALAAL